MATVPYLARYRGDDLLRGVGHVVGGDDRQAGVRENLPADVLVRALHPHDQRHRQVGFTHRGDDAVGDGVALHDAAEDVDQDALHLRILQHDLERLGDLLGGCAAADVEEVRGLGAEQLDGVHGRHREPGAVHEAADVAVERDVRKIELRRLDLGGVLLVEVAHGDDVGMPEERIRIEVELGVERDHAAVAGDDQRVDLRERRVGFVERAVQALQHRAALRDAARGDAYPARDVVGIGIGETLERIDEHAMYLLRRLRGDRLDIHAAFGARHQAHALRHAVDHHGDVELLPDVRAFLDQQPADFLPRRSRSGA